MKVVILTAADMKNDFKYTSEVTEMPQQGDSHYFCYCESKTYVTRPLSKRPQFGFQDQLSLNAGQKYCRMLQREHSAILSTFIKLPFVIKIIVLSIFEWPIYTGCTVCCAMSSLSTGTDFSNINENKPTLEML